MCSLTPFRNSHINITHLNIESCCGVANLLKNYQVPEIVIEN